MVNALQLWIQVLGINIPSELAVMLPYILTILVLAASGSKMVAPSALTKPFERE
jgi:simple sugar transport system permease protein